MTVAGTLEFSARDSVVESFLGSLFDSMTSCGFSVIVVGTSVLLSSDLAELPSGLLSAFTSGGVPAAVVFGTLFFSLDTSLIEAVPSPSEALIFVCAPSMIAVGTLVLSTSISSVKSSSSVDASVESSSSVGSS